MNKALAAAAILAASTQAQAGGSASFGFLYHALNLTLMMIWGGIGIYATGATFGKVMAATRQFLQRRQS